MWEEEENVHCAFLRKLTERRARECMQSVPFLQFLRTDYDKARVNQKLFGHVYARYGTDIYKLIAKACNEVWDEEDEEKNAFRCSKKEAAVKQREYDDLAPAREKGSRSRQHELQGVSEASERLLEKGRSEQTSKKGSQAQAGRGESFYRRAGGT